MGASFYVTTPIYYVNDKPHIGHAYTTLACDTLARWHRLMGESVYFLTGTDEHGMKIERAAEKSGITPQAHADKFSQRFRDMWADFGLSHDDFIRTTEPRHQTVVQEIWRRMAAKGDIYLGGYEGWYSVGDEAYFTEDELVDGKAPSGHTVEWVKEPSYFFKLSKYGPQLLEYLKENPNFIRPKSRYNEILRFVEGGLRDLSISRTSFSWGVPVPDDPEHVAYVWIDALTNYISALGGPGTEKFEQFWPSALHVIGKDILRFHTVFWPCFLMSAGLPLPKQVFAHGWWTADGVKMSKSFGNVVDPIDMKARYGLDAFRFFLLREVTFGQDGDFSERALCNRINGDLANDLGNLLNRNLAMVKRYHGGNVPPRGEKGPEDDALFEVWSTARADLFKAVDDLAFHRALEAIWTLVRHGNKYVDACAPWVLAREGNTERLNEVMYNVCELCRVVGLWTLAFIPEKADEMLNRLGVAEADRTLASTETWGGLASGGETRIGDPLFPKVESPEQKADAEAKAKAKAEAKAKAKADKAKKKAQQQAQQKAEKKAEDTEGGFVEYDDFARLEIKVARIVAAEKHPNADRLLKLTVDAGEPEHRTVCAGIAGAYAPEDLVGTTVTLLANLKPRKIRGVVSQGMLLAAGDDANVKLMTVPGDIPSGTRVS
ncbi:MAG: methionine--tRNA ligase [Bradymonadia bacterium]